MISSKKIGKGWLEEFTREKNGVSKVIDFPAGQNLTPSVVEPLVTGAIKIRLPRLWDASMVLLKVDIIAYAGRSISIFCGGQTSTDWNHPFANIISGTQSGDFQVRFGDDGVRACIWIGETNSDWRYLQVSVTDCITGSIGADSRWLSGWEISIEESFDTVSHTLTGNLPYSDWNKIKNIPEYLLEDTPPVDGTYADVTALLADQNAQTEDYFYEVTDASDFAIVNSGAAIVLLNETPSGSANDYVVIWGEDLTSIQNITEIPNRSYSDLQNKIAAAHPGMDFQTLGQDTVLTYTDYESPYIVGFSTSKSLPEPGFEDHYNGIFNFQGTAAETLTLEDYATNGTKTVTVINEGTATLTVQSFQTNGGNEIWDAGTVVDTVDVLQGEMIELLNNSNYWVVKNKR